MKKIISTVSKQQMEQYLSEFSSLYDLAEHLQTTRHILVNTIEFLDLQVPKRVFYTCDEDFFSKINEQSMYYAGFIAADGNLRFINGSYILKIKLAEKDKDILEKLKIYIKSTYKLYNDDNEKFKYSVFKITSKKIFDDLHKFGITPKKSLTYTIPQWVLEHPLLPHFIRGFADGDGCWSEILNKNNKIRSICFNIGGASSAVKQLYDIIKIKCNINNEAGFSIQVGKKFKNPFYTLQFRDIREVDKIVNYLYHNASIYLERKKIIALKISECKENSQLYHFDSEELQQLYDKYGNFVDIAKIFNCNPSTIRINMIKLGLKYNKSPYKHKDKIFNFTAEELESKYKELKTISAMAEFYGCSCAKISQAFSQFGLLAISKRKK